MNTSEFEKEIEWVNNSEEKFVRKFNMEGFIEPALLAVITSLIGEISLLYITMHI